MTNYEITPATAFHSFMELSAHIADVLGLSRVNVESALSVRRGEFGRFEDIDREALFSLERAIWDDVTDSAEWPF